MKTNRLKFHELHSIPPEGMLDLPTIAVLSGIPQAALVSVYRRATTPKEGAKADPFNEKKKKPQKPVSGPIVFKKKPVAELPSSFSIPPTGKGKGFNRLYAFAMAHHAGKGKFGKDEDIARVFGLIQEVPQSVQPSPVLSVVELLLQCPDSAPICDHTDYSDSDDDSQSHTQL